MRPSSIRRKSPNHRSLRCLNRVYIPGRPARDRTSALVVYWQAIDTIFRMPIYHMLNRWDANPVTPNTGLWLVESNVETYEYWWAEYFILGQATPSDLNVVNSSALCPIDHACTLDRFWVTTYPLTQSLGGACYSRQVAHVTFVAPNTRDIWHAKYACALLAHITVGGMWISGNDLLILNLTYRHFVWFKFECCTTVVTIVLVICCTGHTR